ncbi:MAG: hypothetical protein M1114_01645 [Candidatus Dependentiae bacterium]|nr:hypothetical protein [Candidatus Dependentiae bacterium]
MNKKNNPTIKNIFAIVYIFIAIGTIHAMDPYEEKINAILVEKYGREALLFLLDGGEMPKEYKKLLKKHKISKHVTRDQVKIIDKCVDNGYRSEDDYQEPEEMPKD